MASQRRCFPYEQSVVFNALYDTVERLGLSLDSANSARGTLIVSNAEHTGRILIALGSGPSEDETQVEICPEKGETSFAEAWGPIIMDELTGSMTRVYPIERGGM